MTTVGLSSCGAAIWRAQNPALFASPTRSLPHLVKGGVRVESGGGVGAGELSRWSATTQVGEDPSFEPNGGGGAPTDVFLMPTQLGVDPNLQPYGGGREPDGVMVPTQVGAVPPS